MMYMAKDELVLITGATGFLGSYVLRYLIKEGYTNIKATRRTHSRMELLSQETDKVEWLNINLLDELELVENMRGVSLLIHAAAKVSYKKSDLEDLRISNHEVTRNIVNAALQVGVKKMVYVSSVAAVGKQPDGGMINESCEWDPHIELTPYAVSKYDAEMEVWRASAEGLSVSILNPSVILGAGFWSNSSTKIFGRMAKHQLLYPIGGNGFVDVRDVAKLCIRLIDPKYDGQRYIANAENWSFKKLMDEISSEYKIDGPRWPISKWVIPISWRLMGVLAFITRTESIYSKHTVLSSSRVSAYDNAKSKADLNYNYLPLEKTIRDSAAAFVASRECGQDYGRLDLI